AAMPCHSMTPCLARRCVAPVLGEPGVNVCVGRMTGDSSRCSGSQQCASHALFLSVRLLLSPSLSLSHTHTLSLSLSLTLSVSHSVSCCASDIHTHTHSLSLSLSHSLFHTLCALLC